MVQFSSAQVSNAGVIAKAFASGLTIGTSGFVFSSGGVIASGVFTSGLMTSSNSSRFRITFLHHISGGANVIVKGFGVPNTWGALNNGNGLIGSGQITSFDMNVRSGIVYDYMFSSSGIVDYFVVDEYIQG